MFLSAPTTLAGTLRSRPPRDAPPGLARAQGTGTKKKWGAVKAMFLVSCLPYFSPMGGSVVSAAVSIDNFIEQNNVHDNVTNDTSPENPPPPSPDHKDAINSTDCSALQELSKTDPSMIEGSTLAIIKDKCDQGSNFTAKQVAEEVKKWEGPNPPIDDQIANIATEICEKVSTMDDQVTTKIKEACGEDTRRDEHVVDVAAKLQAQHSPAEGTIDLVDLCASLNENRTEIEAGLAVLESRSNERRLDDSTTTKVSSFGLASDMIVMLECFCNDDPDNKGCTKKQLKFMESITTSVMEKSDEDFSKGPANALSELESSLKKHTNNLRTHLSTKSENDVQTSVERAMSEVGVGKCDPPGVQQTPGGGFKICLYAGPFFECEVAWDPSSESCVSGTCGGGEGLKLMAETTFCIKGKSKSLELKLKLCVDVVSDILEMIGKYVPGSEKIMNYFGIYGGCYLLGVAQYDIKHNRFKVTIGPHRKWFGNFNVYGGASVHIRFGTGSNYDDDLDWATYDYIAQSYPNPGKINDFYSQWNYAKSEAKNNMNRKPNWFNNNKWSIAAITFGIEMSYLIGKKDIWSTAAHFLVTGSRPQASGRCGPLYSGRVCDCDRYEMFCNEDNGWCATRKVHHGEAYDCRDIPQYTSYGKGVAGPEKWLNVYGQGVDACYQAILQNPQCADDYFTYVPRGDKNCGCKTPGALRVRSSSKADYYSVIQPYAFAGTGVAGPEKWLNVYGQGVAACYQAIMRNPQCADDYFTYVPRGDKNCGCKTPGALRIRGSSKADYYKVYSIHGEH